MKFCHEILPLWLWGVLPESDRSADNHVRGLGTPLRNSKTWANGNARTQRSALRAFGQHAVWQTLRINTKLQVETNKPQISGNRCNSMSKRSGWTGLWSTGDLTWLRNEWYLGSSAAPVRKIKRLQRYGFTRSMVL
jgi:hypothetical protein